MSKLPRLCAVVIVVALVACGLPDRGDTDGIATDSLVAISSTTEPARPDAAMAADSIGALPTGVPTDTLQLADSVPAQAVVGDASAPIVGPPPQEPSSLAEQINAVLIGQATITRRLDSLAMVTARSDTTGVNTDAGEVLGAAGDQVRSFGVGVIWSVLVLILFNLLIRAIVWLLDTLAERNASQRLLYKQAVPIIRIVLWAFAAYLIVSVIFRVDAQGVFAAAAAIGVAVGFAAQDLLKNLFGGLILVFDQPFQVGDKVSVGGTYGEVVSIGLRSTRIVTPDDNLVSVPNAQVVDQQVANANAGELNCQVVTDLYLPGWTDEVTAKKIAFGAAASSKYVYLNKPIVVLVADVFKETFLTRVRVKAYVLDPRFEFLFQSDVTERARAGFREAGLLTPEDFRIGFHRPSVLGNDATEVSRELEETDVGG